MAKSFAQKAVLFKQETTQGTDAGPTVSANAFRTIDYAPTFMQADGKVRNIDVPYFGAKPTLLANFRRGANFGLEMAGAGSPTGVPAWMVLAQMCGFGAGVVGASSVVQSGSAISSSFTHYALFLDELDATKSLILKALGGKSTFGFRIEDDDFPRFNFGYLGRPPASLADEGPLGQTTYAGQAAPVIASTENTTFTLDGYALPLRSCELNSNADLALRSLIGPQDYINYRNDAWGGTIVGELPSLAAHNYFANVRPGTLMPMAITHGVTAGNIVQISSPSVQVTGDVTIENEDDKVMFSMPVSLIPVNGNDEITFTSM